MTVPPVASASEAFWEVPTLFWWRHSDAFFRVLSWLGLLMSAALLAGVESRIILMLSWVVYGSFVHAGQIFYGYGWDILLCETGFLSVFLAPPFRPWLFSSESPPPLPVIVLFRWLAFRLMFGAGLIKIRGDECWRDLTCLYYHYETQPIGKKTSTSSSGGGSFFTGGRGCNSLGATGLMLRFCLVEAVSS